MTPRVALLAAVVLVSAFGANSQTLEALGYLHEGHAPDTSRVVPPAPATESPAGVADRAVFRATRALKDTPRWALAQNDVNESIPAMLKDFSCASATALDEKTAPRLAALLQKMRYDVLAGVNRPKALYKRQRPYLIDEGEICVPKTDSLAASPDYPSGHATWGWAVGLVLAELAPQHASDVLVRARAFGESRVVCGVHNASALEGAYVDGAALVASLHGDAAFRTDLEASRKELSSLKAARPAGCAAEASLTAKTPW